MSTPVNLNVRLHPDAYAKLSTYAQGRGLSLRSALNIILLEQFQPAPLQKLVDPGSATHAAAPVDHGYPVAPPRAKLKIITCLRGHRVFGQKVMGDKVTWDEVRILMDPTLSGGFAIYDRRPADLDPEAEMLAEHSAKGYNVTWELADEVIDLHLKGYTWPAGSTPPGFDEDPDASPPQNVPRG